MDEDKKTHKCEEIIERILNELEDADFLAKEGANVIL